METNQEQLKKLARIFNIDKVVTAEDLAEVLKGVLGIMNSFKKDNEVLNSETKKAVNELLKKVEAENDNLNVTFSKEARKIKDEINSNLKKSQAFLEKIESIKAVPGKDGLDGVPADEEQIVKDVLKKIELPKYKETILDGRQEIVEKINTGKKNDLKIEAKQVEGFDKLINQSNLDRAISILDQRTQFLINKTSGGGVVDSIVAGTNITVDNTDSRNPIISASGAGTPGGSDTQVQFSDAGVFGGDSGFTYDKTTDTATLLGSLIVGTSLLPDANDGATLGSTTLQFSDLFLAEGGVINWDNGDLTITQSGNSLILGGITDIRGSVDNAVALGTTSATWSDLFLGSGAVINFNAGDVTITHAADTLAFAGATSYTFDAPISGTVVAGGLPATEVTGTSQAMAVNKTYISNNAGLVTFTLPDTAALGDIVEVVGKGAGGWKVAQNASESIKIGDVTTTTGTGGYISSYAFGDCVTLKCITANTTWRVTSQHSAGLTYI